MASRGRVNDRLNTLLRNGDGKPDVFIFHQLLTQYLLHIVEELSNLFCASCDNSAQHSQQRHGRLSIASADYTS